MLFSLGWPSARDGVLINILVVVQSKNQCIKMSVQMSNKSKPNNGVNEAVASSESLLPGRCPIGEQDGSGCH